MNSAKDFLGKTIDVYVDRPLGSKHPKYGDIYPLNYGYIKEMKSADGEGLDAYILGVFEPVKKFHGKCIAIIHRLDDNEDKLVVAPVDKDYTLSQIGALTEFQERFFKIKILKR
ncbi:MAG: inorganic diphosphatase [Candidatus Woesearchaeota archaeon]